MALKVLSALDTAKTQFYHFKAIIIAGMGLFTDAYDLFCIPPIMVLIGHVYYQDDHVQNPKDLHRVPIWVSSTMFATALLGTVIGQLVFGRLGDRMGRQRVYGLALMLMILGSIGCGFSICTTRGCVLGSLGFFRFLLGMGIGGDYPLSATIMSEFANKRTRGAFIAAVFSMQGFGILVSSTVTMVVCTIFDAASHGSTHGNRTPMAVDVAWRLILMIGAIPASMTFYWRMMMPETARYTALVERNVLQAAKNMEKVLQVSLSQIAEDSEYPPPHPPSYRLLSKDFFRRHGRDLFSCAITWFLVDIVFYSINLVLSQVNSSRYLNRSTNIVNAYQDAYHAARLQAIIAICSTIPGYFATVYFIDRVGRVKIQITGFLLMAFAFLAVGIPYSAYWYRHTNIGFLLLYGLTFFFANFGPNTTTFIVPAELFPARFRSTCHGISGAIGKVGAIVGAVGFVWVTNQEDSKTHERRMTVALVILGGVSFLGATITYFFTRETNGRSLEENENEEDESMGHFFLRGFGFNVA